MNTARWLPCLLVAGAGHAMPAQALTCGSWSGYEVTGEKVRYVRGGAGVREIKRTLRVDPKTFRRLEGQDLIGYGSCSAGYAADAVHAFYEGRPMAGADVRSLRLIGASGSVYAKDQRRVYGEGVPISSAIDTFQAHQSGYGTDGDAIFWGRKRLPGRQLTTFVVYAKSEAAAFLYGEVLPGVEAKTFEESAQRSNYAWDAKAVLYQGRRISGADRASFVVMPESYDTARDRYRVYFGGDVIKDADPATIAHIAGYYLRDRRAVYLEGKELPGSDPATFRLQSMSGDADDRFYHYAGHKVVCKHDALAAGPMPQCPWTRTN